MDASGGEVMFECLRCGVAVEDDDCGWEAHDFTPDVELRCAVAVEERFCEECLPPDEDDDCGWEAHDFTPDDDLAFGVS